jgi:NAD(P)-dependent dehydrogenase (short-subunit alcohol dehydrogenase family)
MNLKTSIALVTGAGRTTGIGFETAIQLADQGVKVILTARDTKSAFDRAKELADKGLDVIGKQLDVTDISSVSRIASEIEHEFGQLNMLINNAAGMAPYGELGATADLRVAHEVIETTLFGTWRLTQALLPLMRKSQHARIVNVSSGAGSHGDAAFGLNTANSMGTSYAVAKAALNALTVKLANE